ncbi:MAG: hypothetical protein ABI647_17325 [Gemmatimonadota bacterium]
MARPAWLRLPSALLALALLGGPQGLSIAETLEHTARQSAPHPRGAHYDSQSNRNHADDCLIGRPMVLGTAPARPPALAVAFDGATGQPRIANLAEPAPPTSRLPLPRAPPSLTV